MIHDYDWANVFFALCSKNSNPDIFLSHEKFRVPMETMLANAFSNLFFFFFSLSPTNQRSNTDIAIDRDTENLGTENDIELRGN